VARKKSAVDDMIDDVKHAATSIGDAVGLTDPIQVERIVPIPQIDVYSELPFALVEKNGKRVVLEKLDKPAKVVAKPKKKVAPPKRASKAKASKPNKK
jgi:hypothetical protein